MSAIPPFGVAAPPPIRADVFQCGVQTWGGASWGEGECLQYPVSPRHAYSTRTHAYAHTLLLCSKRVSPVWSMNQRGGGRPNNWVTQWEAGEGSCTLRAAAIKAWGSNGEHLAAEHHGHSSLFVYGDEEVKPERRGLTKRMAWSAGGKKRVWQGSKAERTSVYACRGWGTSKSFMSQRLRGGGHVPHCCSTLRAEDSKAPIFPPLSFIVKPIMCKQNNNTSTLIWSTC